MNDTELETAQFEMRERQLYGDAPAPATAKGKAGRKANGIARTIEVRDKVTGWKLTPPEKRQPPTIRALAAELGVSKSTVEYHLEQAPDGLEEVLELAEADELRERYPRIIKTLGDLAEAGNPDALRIYIKELRGPDRQQPKAQPPIDNRLQLAIQNLIVNRSAAPGPENQAPAHPPTIEGAMELSQGGMPDSTLRQIEELREIQRIRS